MEGTSGIVVQTPSTKSGGQISQKLKHFSLCKHEILQKMHQFTSHPESENNSRGLLRV